MAKLHVLLDNGPAGVTVFHKRAEERGKVDVALADYGENFVLDGFLEGPLVLARFVENFVVAVLDMDEA